MIFSVSNDGIELSLHLIPDLVTLTVKDLVQEMTISSQEFLLASWSLWSSQRHQFLHNHLVRIPVTRNQQGTHEMRDEVPSRVGAQDIDKGWYQVCADLNQVEFYWEYDQLDVVAVFYPTLILLFHQQRLTTWRWEIQQKTPFFTTKKKTRRTLLLL